MLKQNIQSSFRSRFVRRCVWFVCLAQLPLLAYAERAYVSNEDGQTVTVIDTGKGAVIETVNVGKRPRGLKLSKDGEHLYVAVSGLPKCPPNIPDEECEKLERDLEADGIAVVDTATLKVLKVLEGGSDPETFDLSADGQLLFVTNEDAAKTSVLDVKNGAIKAQIAVGKEPEGVRVSPNGKWVLVTNESDNAVAIIDAHTHKVLRTVAVGKRPRDVAFTPDSRTAYVSGEFDSSVYRVAVPDGAPVERFMGCSTFSNYTVLPEIAVAKIREDAPFEKVCYIGCGVTTGIGAVMNTAKVEPGANVVVFGLGGIGLNVIQGARLVGANKIIGVDINPRRKALAEKFGMLSASP